MSTQLEQVELFAWLGEDEFGSGEIGLKQGVVPAGRIPVVAIHRDKVEKYWSQAEAQASRYGKRIYLCRFMLVEVVKQTREGQ